MYRRAKIIATLGPAVDRLEAVDELIATGVDVTRLNFSHGDHPEHKRRIEMVRDCATRARKPVAVLQDLSGPKIRTGSIEPVDAVADVGQTVRLVEGKSASFPDIAVNFPGVVAGLEVGDRVLLDDGRIELRVEQTGDSGVRCKVEGGGELRNRVGVHVPSHRVQSPTFTEKDRVDLAFGLELGVDYVALSFVRDPQDLRDVRAFCEQRGTCPPLVAKIETPQAVDALGAIIDESDAIMVARGDLGVEFSPEAVPVLQRRIVEQAHQRRKPVIIATEMLQSMIHEERPTRAEASDVAYAVFEGADAVMLSAETATGDHPAEAVRMMDRIVSETERSLHFGEGRADTAPRLSLTESLAHNAADIADEIGAAALVAFTLEGVTARLVASARPNVPLIALSPSEQTRRRMALYWGVRACRADTIAHSDHLLELANQELLDRGFIKPGESFVAVFCRPVVGGRGANSLSVRIAG